MSVYVMEWVTDNSRAKSTARFVLVAIAKHANHDGGGAHPSVATLQHKTALSERAVRLALGELERIGELVVERGAGPNGCNAYRIVMTPARDAGSTESTLHDMPLHEMQGVHEMHHPPATDALLTVHDVPPTRPLTVLDSSLETHSAEAALFDTAPAIGRKPKASKKTKPDGHWSEDSDFVAWYQAYVKKSGPADAYRAWPKAIEKPNFPGVQELLRLTQAFTAAFLASGTELRFAKDPATWLNKECWHDPLPASARASPNGNRLVGADTRNGQIDWDDPEMLRM